MREEECIDIQEALDEYARQANEYEDGTQAFWIMESKWEHPEYQVLLVTAKNPERLATLRALHNEWYNQEPIDDE